MAIRGRDPRLSGRVTTQGIADRCPAAVPEVRALGGTQLVPYGMMQEKHSQDADALSHSLKPT